MNPCAAVGSPDVTDSVGKVPVHIQAGADLWYSVIIDWQLAKPYSGPPQVVLTRISHPAPLEMLVEVVLTTDPSALTGYQVATLRGDPAIEGGIVAAVGELGALNIGDYRITGRVDTYEPATHTLTPACSPGEQSLPFTVHATNGISPVVEFYNTALDHYFMTQDAKEISDLDLGVHPGWVRTGQSFFAYRPGESSLMAMHRFYGLPSAGLDTHFFTPGASADDFALRVGSLAKSWEMESDDAFELDSPDYSTGACPSGTIPIYRLWNQRVDSNHRYTTDPAIKAEMIAKGYVAEGWGDNAVFLCGLSGT